MERALEARELPGKFIAGCTAVFALAMAAAALSAAADYGPAGLFGWALCISAFSAVFAAALWAQSRLPGRALLPVIFAAALLLRLPFALLPDEAQSSDFALLYSAAQGLAAGDASALSGAYFLRWGYQIPFVLYEALVIRLGGGVAALRVLNALWMSGSCVLACLLAESFAGRRAGFAAGLLFALYPGALTLAPVLTNQHISLFFTLLGLWLLLERGPFSESGGAKSRLLWGAAAGLSLAFGNLMRPEGALALASALVTAAALLISGRLGFKRLALPLAAVFAAYFALGFAASAAVTASGIAPGGIGNNRPEWKLVLGLDTASGGTYSAQNEYILDIEDDGVRRTAALEAIDASLSGCADLPGFFWGKLRLMWGAMDDLSFVSGGLPAERLVLIAERAAFLLAAALAALGCAKALRRGAGAAGLLLMCMVSANFVCYLFIEVQPRYRFSVVPALFALAAGAGLRYGHRGEKRV